MTNPPNDMTPEELAAKRKKSESGKGEAGAVGAITGGIQFSAEGISERNKTKIKTEHRRLVASDLIDAIVEFFSELPMRASANLSVNWEKTKNNVKSFAIVNWIVEFGDRTVRDLARNRTRGPDMQKNQQAFMKPSNGPTGAQ